MKTEVKIPMTADENARKRLDGKRLACGQQTINRFARLLLPEGMTTVSIHAAGWIYNHFELSLMDTTDQEFVFVFEPRDDRRDCFVRTKELNIYYHGSELPEFLFQALTARISHFLQNVTLADIAELVSRDPELGAPRLVLPSGINDDDRPANFLDNWGTADLYSNFLAEGEMARGKLDSLDIFDRASVVQHCDAECMNMKPNVNARILKMVNYPWMKPANVLRALKQQHENATKEIREGKTRTRAMLATNIQESDLIAGNPEKLRRVLDRVVSIENQEMIFFSNTCTPTVAGEDVHSVVKEYQQKAKVPLIYLTVTPQSMEEVFFDLFVTKRIAAQNTGKTDINPNAINLIGFYKDEYLAEIILLLSMVGIEVNSVLLPEIDTEAIQRVPYAAHNVFYPNSLWDHFYDQLKIQSSGQNHILEAPYGMTGTREWLLSISAALGKRREAEEIWSQECAQHLAEWESLRAQASSHALGIVFRSEEAHHFTQSSHTWGIPVLKTLLEMGFRLEVLFRATNSKEAYETAQSIHSHVDSNPNLTIKGFNSFAMMMERLCNSQAAAFFSYHFFDWRLTSSGKYLFSTQDFDLGIRGAMATLRRLLNICQMPFYRRYGKYLKRTTEGLRLDR